MRRLLSACLAFVLLLTLSSALQAQLGGLKKKVADKVTGKKDTTAAASTASNTRCDKSTLVITSDVMNRYMKALDARDAEIQKMAKEPSAVGRYYAATQRRETIEKRKHEFELRRGPDWERYKPIYLRMVKGDQAALKEQQALADSLDPNKVQVPNLEWEDQQKGNARLDSVMMAASGIAPCDWGAQGLGERLPQLMRILLNDPNAKDLQGFGTQQEAAAIKPRLNELATRMGYVGRGKGEMTEAEKAHVKAEDEKLAEQATMTGDPYTDCVTKFNKTWGIAHQAEMERASKAGNMAEMQRLALLQVKEAHAKCGDKSEDDDDE